MKSKFLNCLYLILFMSVSVFTACSGSDDGDSDIDSSGGSSSGSTQNN